LAFPLLVRGRYGIRLTKEGEQLLPAVRRFLAAGNELDREMSAVKRAACDTIRIAAFDSVAQHWLPAILQQLRALAPSIGIETMQGGREEIYQGVQQGRFDIGFLSQPITEDAVFLPLHDDPLLALLPKDTFPEYRDSFPVRAYEALQFLMPASGFDCDVNVVLSRSGVSPEIQRTSVSDPAVISMVEHHLGVSMLSELCLRGCEQQVRILPLEPASSRRLGMVLRRGAPVRSAVRQLILCAQQTVPTLY
jgi:DNA-binding transcriptional LysR family regulator